MLSAMEFPSSISKYSRHAVMLILVTLGIGYVGGEVASGGKVGVAIGQDGDNLPPPNETVELLLSYKIERVRIYNTNASLLSVLARSGIEVVVQVQNEDIEAIAHNPVVGYNKDGNQILFAEKWILDNIYLHVLNGTMITEILVGNEWLGNPKNNPSWLVPALYNIHKALQTIDPSLKITVNTPHTFGILNNSYPPSKGTFDPKYHSVLRDVLGFLLETQSPAIFEVNIFPYFSYRDNLDVSLAYATFQSTSAVVDPYTSLSYYNIFDAQVDAVYFAIDDLLPTIDTLSSQSEQPTLTEVGDGSSRRVAVKVQESGWPKGATGIHSTGSHNGGPPGRSTLKNLHVDEWSRVSETRSQLVYCKRDDGANIRNAQTYNQNNIIHVLKSKGTPAVPDYPLSVFVFALYDEDLKVGDATERTYGIFYPSKTPAYYIDFNPPIHT